MATAPKGRFSRVVRAATDALGLARRAQAVQTVLDGKGQKIRRKLLKLVKKDEDRDKDADKYNQKLGKVGEKEGKLAAKRRKLRPKLEKLQRKLNR